MKNTSYRLSAASERSPLVPACLAVLALLCSTARADDDPNPYTLGVLETVSHDSNVFRAPDGPAVSTDWLSTTGLVGTLDQPIGRERLKANLEFDLNRFKRNTQLNSAAHSISLEGDWATIDNLSGELGYSDSSQLFRYSLDSAQTITAKNTQDIHQGFARFHLGSVTRLTFDAIFNGLDKSYSADAYRSQDLRRWDGSFGVRYGSSPDLSTSLSYRRTNGEYPNYSAQQADHFTRNDIIFGLVYAASGASTFNLRASVANEDHSVITTRNSHTWAADGKWIWVPTGRTQLTLDFVRDDDTGSTDTPFFNTVLSSTDARRRTAVSGVLSYELTSKIKLHANGTFGKRDLDTAFTDVPTLGTQGSDRLYVAGLGLDYLPTRNIQLGCTASHEKRTVQGAPSTITYPYRDTVLSCTGEFSFN